MKVALLPFEIKLVPEYDEVNFKVYNYLSRVDKAVLSMIFDDPVLSESVGYVFDAYQRYYNGDVEGARTSLRNAVQVVRDKVLKGVKKIEGIEKMADYVRGLVRALYSMACPGGPHPGPVPKTTTEFMLLVVPELINYIAKRRE